MNNIELRKCIHEESVEICETCCAHEFDPDEGYICLWCGKEGYEEMLSRQIDFHDMF